MCQSWGHHSDPWTAYLYGTQKGEGTEGQCVTVSAELQGSWCTAVNN